MNQQELAEQLKGFRQALGDFYKIRGYHENAAIQDYTTQIYWNILELQHRRLQEKGIELDFTSLQEKYTEGGPLRFSSFFDGKYEITEATEEIASTRLYYYNGRQLYKRRNNQLATYTLLNAKEQGANEIVCPNCGHVTTRENLLDGCDYCHSRYTVEDLGRRISSFALRNDWNITHAKYQQGKQEISNWLNIAVGLVGATVGFVGSIIILPFLNLSFLTKLGYGAAATALCSFLAISLVNGIINSFFRSTTVDVGRALGGPSTGSVNVAEVLAEGLYADQEMQDGVQEEDHISPQTAQLVQKQDPLFSLTGFLSNAENKLSVLLYAKTAPQINALANCDLSKFLNEYRDVFEADVALLQLVSYEHDEELQTAHLTGKLRLVLHDSYKHIVERQDKFTLELQKSSKCKTQAIRGPEVLICKCCGASLSLLEGKVCQYCSQELNLVDYDWTIANYTITESKILATRV